MPFEIGDRVDTGSIFLELLDIPLNVKFFEKNFFSSSGINPFRGNFMRGIRISNFRDLKIFPRIKKKLFMPHF
jgi:hypothetical protein